MLECMKYSHFVAFTIVKRIESDALVEVEDFFIHERFVLSDFGLGRFNSGKDLFYELFIMKIFIFKQVWGCFKKNNVWLKKHKNINEWNARDLLELEMFYQKYRYYDVVMR